MSEPRVTLPLFRQRRSDGDTRLRRVSILGATGSIGNSTLDIVRLHPEAYQIVALVGGQNVTKMALLAAEFCPETIAMADEKAALALRNKLPQDLNHIKIAGGRQAVLEASAVDVDISIAAITGIAGLEPALMAIRSGNDIALANKEALVCAGPVFMEMAREYQVDIVPIDSEHSALFQCLLGQDLHSVENLILTASGGPFRALAPTELGNVTVEQALAHPNWSMGNKVTIDSATMMNKGFEVIEARWLFDVEPNRLQAVIHPQSIIHSMASFRDGGFIAQMGLPSMMTPISLALSWPTRLDLERSSAAIAAFDPISALSNWSGLTFEAIDGDRFPCFMLARQAMTLGIYACTALNAANELAVDAFLKGKIPFHTIAKLVEKSLDQVTKQGFQEVSSLADVLALDAECREQFRL